MSQTTTEQDTGVRYLGVGIDTARYGHHVTFLRDDRQPASAALTIQESGEGYERLKRALLSLADKHVGAQFFVRIDAAGQYAGNLESFLRSLPLPMAISVGEPKRNRDYRQAHFPKRKSDATDSEAMARFAVVERPVATVTLPKEFRPLREAAGRLQGRVRDATRGINRFHNLLACTFPELAVCVDDVSAGWVLTLLKKYPTAEKIAGARLSSLTKIPYLKEETARQIQAAADQSIGTFRGDLAEDMMTESVSEVASLLRTKKNWEELLLKAYRALPDGPHRQVETIPGIGEITAAVLVAKIVDIKRFASPENLVGYFGVFPEENTSGVDKFGRALPKGSMRMSAKGNDLVRSYLWNAARSAITHNPAVRALYHRLRARGARGDVALGHCMCKLLHLVFAVWSSGKPFDKDHYPWEKKEAAKDKTSKDAPTQNESTAGHKRDVVPEDKVVTAATSKVEDVPSPVKQHLTTRSQVSSSRSIDYAYLRQQVTIEQVLRHWGYFDRLRGRGSERRGPCPIHTTDRPGSRSFSVNLAKNVFQCFHPPCATHGNTLDLWAAAKKLPLHEAALDLAQTFHLQTTRNREDGARNPNQKDPRRRTGRMP